jgi:glycosyltransferase involved in cell wall biosynthesis
VEEKRLTLSLVVPIYNEEKNILPLYQRITDVLEAGPLDYRTNYEVILVDDGSHDESFAACVAIAQRDPRVRVVQFRRNFGKTAALHAGFSLVRGAQVVTIDADMQEDPGEMFRLLEPLDSGYDVVSAWRKTRNDPLLKTLLSQVFNIVVARLSHIPLHDFNCGFKAYSGAAVHDLRCRLYGDLHRFIPLLAHQQGFRVTEVVVAHQSRRFGKSKFGNGRLLNGYLDFIQVLFLTTFLHRPLRLFGLVGTLFFALGLIISIHLSWLWLLGEAIGHRPLLILGVLLLITGLQSISTGLLGEMLRNSAFRSGDEYSIRRIVSHDTHPADNQDGHPLDK